MNRTGSRTKVYPKCASCEKRDTCDKKKLCAEAYLIPATAEVTANVAEPAARETRTIMVNGNPTVVYEDDIKQAIEQSLFKERFIHFGA
jgi:hypothetical protein